MEICSKSNGYQSADLLNIPVLEPGKVREFRKDQGIKEMSWKIGSGLYNQLSAKSLSVRLCVLLLAVISALLVDGFTACVAASNSVEGLRLRQLLCLWNANPQSVSQTKVYGSEVFSFPEPLGIEKSWRFVVSLLFAE